MNHVRWDSLPAPLRQFFHDQITSADGAVIEENGQPMFRILAYPKSPNGAPEPEWTEADNRRRCALIDKEIDGQLQPEERIELETLGRRLHRYVNRVAPLPLEPLRQLHQHLLEKAAGS